MRKITNICFYVVMSSVAILGVLFFEKTEFKVIIIMIMAVFVWFYYEIDRAQEYDDDDMSF